MRSRHVHSNADKRNIDFTNWTKLSSQDPKFILGTGIRSRNLIRVVIRGLRRRRVVQEASITNEVKAPVQAGRVGPTPGSTSSPATSPPRLNDSSTVAMANTCTAGHPFSVPFQCSVSFQCSDTCPGTSRPKPSTSRNRAHLWNTVWYRGGYFTQIWAQEKRFWKKEI